VVIADPAHAGDDVDRADNELSALPQRQPVVPALSGG
jgi:hypothetical protein